MKRNKQKNQAGRPRPSPPSDAGRSGPARTSRRWISLAAVLGSIALVSGVTYFFTRPDKPGSAPKGESPTGRPANLPAGAPSNRLAGIVLKSAPDGSNWDAVITGQKKDSAATELATRANTLLA